MADRWWAPTTGRVGPDPVDFALLQNDGEPRYDLGAALLALHRVGAAACQDAADTPLVDEVTLVNKIATAREVFAAPLVESVSKSVSGAAYAGLLVRDVFDDAERGALTLFRACVSKGVPRPIAAQRAGAVYGVPWEQMGPYRTLATDLRAHPVALADAADRVLFSTVEKIASAEVEEVSKQLTPQGRQALEQFAERRPRGPSGEFVELPETQVEAPPAPAKSFRQWLAERLGGAGPAAPEVAPVEAPPKPAVKKPVRPAHKERLGRMGRIERMKPKPVAELAATTRTGPRLGPKIGPKISPRVQAWIGPPALKPDVSRFRALHPHPTELPRNMMDVVTHGDDVGPWLTLQGEYSFLVNPSQIEGAESDYDAGPILHSRMEVTRDQYHPFVFRIGHLADLTGGQPVKKADRIGGQTQEYVDYLESSANLEWSAFTTDAEAPETKFIPAAKLLKMSPVEEQEYIQSEINQMASGPDRKYVQRLVHPDADQEDPNDPDAGVWLVLPKAPNIHEPDDRPLVGLTEYVVRNPIGRGDEHNVYLRPNQVYTLDPTEVPHQYWDEENQVIVTRYYVSPISDEILHELRLARDTRRQQKRDGGVDKALSPQGRRRLTEFAERRPRDEQGEFTELAEAPAPAKTFQQWLVERGAVTPETTRPAVTRKPKPGQRLERMGRMGRLAPRLKPAAEAQPETTLRTGPRVAPKIVPQIAAIVTEKMGMEGRRDLPALSDSSEFLVLHPRKMVELLRQNRREGHEYHWPKQAGEALQLGTFAHDYLWEEDPLPGPEAEDLMRVMTSDLIDEQEGALGFRTLATFRADVHSNAGKEQIADKIINLFQRDPKLHEVHIDVSGDEITLSGNNQALVQRLVLLHKTDDLDWHKPIEIVYLGEAESKDLRRAYHLTDELMDERVHPFNAPLQIFEIVNVPLQMGRLQNVPE